MLTPVLVAVLVASALALAQRRPRPIRRLQRRGLGGSTEDFLNLSNTSPSKTSPANTSLSDRFVPESTVNSIVRWCARRLRRRSIQTRERRSAIELVAAFAAELRAGQPVRQALVRAQESSPDDVAAHAVAVADLGGDVPRALDLVAAQAELPVLRSLAALWRVAEGSGAGLAQAADRLAIAQAESELARAELSAQLAGPRATARVLAGLPLLGMLLGSGLGASPLAWLFGSVWGWLILVVGCVLEVLGLWWISRLTHSVEVLL
ncbi:MAG: type II secretion system F family protein [Actinobacteria bacterium]|nr:type II secretion system F family protein [Actinomycetota bacterium]